MNQQIFLSFLDQIHYREEKRKIEEEGERMTSKLKQPDKDIVINKIGEIKEYPIFHPEDILNQDELVFIEKNVRDGLNSKQFVKQQNFAEELEDFLIDYEPEDDSREGFTIDALTNLHNFLKVTTKEIQPLLQKPSRPIKIKDSQGQISYNYLDKHIYIKSDENNSKLIMNNLIHVQEAKKTSQNNLDDSIYQAIRYGLAIQDHGLSWKNIVIGSSLGFLGTNGAQMKLVAKLDINDKVNYYRLENPIEFYQYGDKKLDYKRMIESKVMLYKCTYSIHKLNCVKKGIKLFKK